MERRLGGCWLNADKTSDKTRRRTFMWVVFIHSNMFPGSIIFSFVFCLAFAHSTLHLLNGNSLYQNWLLLKSFMKWILSAKNRWHWQWSVAVTWNTDELHKSYRMQHVLEYFSDLEVRRLLVGLLGSSFLVKSFKFILVIQVLKIFFIVLNTSINSIR